MKILMALCLFLVGTFGEVLGQAKKNLIILRKGQKIFLERGDYMKDKLYALTDKVDTVEVLLADKSFYKFKKGSFEGWALTNQVDEFTEILAKKSEVVYPYPYKLDKGIFVYREGKLGAEKIAELNKGSLIKVTSPASGYFYPIEFAGKTGYAHVSTIPEPVKTHYHILRAIFDELHNPTVATSKPSEEYTIRTTGKLISKYESPGYSSETFLIGTTYYSITKYNGNTEISSYTVGY